MCRRQNRGRRHTECACYVAEFPNHGRLFAVGELTEAGHFGRNGRRLPGRQSAKEFRGLRLGQAHHENGSLAKIGGRHGDIPGAGRGAAPLIGIRGKELDCDFLTRSVRSMFTTRRRPSSPSLRRSRSAPDWARRRIAASGPPTAARPRIGPAVPSSCWPPAAAGNRPAGKTQRRSANRTSTPAARRRTWIAGCPVGKSIRWSNSADDGPQGGAGGGRKSTTHWLSSSGPQTSAATR